MSDSSADSGSESESESAKKAAKAAPRTFGCGGRGPHKSSCPEASGRKSVKTKLVTKLEKVTPAKAARAAKAAAATKEDEASLLESRVCRLAEAEKTLREAYIRLRDATAKLVRTGSESVGEEFDPELLTPKHIVTMGDAILMRAFGDFVIAKADAMLHLQLLKQKSAADGAAKKEAEEAGEKLVSFLQRSFSSGGSVDAAAGGAGGP